MLYENNNTAVGEAQKAETNQGIIIKEEFRKNRLNDLSGKEWVKGTKSVWTRTDSSSDSIDKDLEVEQALEFGSLLSKAPPRDELKKNHPATFSESDASRLIRFFTRRDEVVLDPFMGTASTGIACLSESRNFIGFELYEKWFKIAQERIGNYRNLYNNELYTRLLCGDSLELLKNLDADSVQFLLTSPPYWGILAKQDHKAKNERIGKGLDTDYGSDKSDLGTIEDYNDFLKILKKHVKQYYRVLSPARYMAMIVSDFRHGQKYYMFHSDVAKIMESAGFVTQGLIALIQDNKKLYPYGYPTTYVPNISNQYIVIGRKLK